MKRNLLIILFLFTMCNDKHPIKSGLEGQMMPDFKLLLTNGKDILNTSNIPKGQGTVLFLFSPSCPYCRNQIREITENIQLLANINVIAISTSKLEDVKKFCSDYQLNKYRNITVGQDINWFLPKYFETTAVPYLVVYNEKKQLKHVFIGITNLEKIKSSLFD